MRFYLGISIFILSLGRIGLAANRQIPYQSPCIAVSAIHQKTARPYLEVYYKLNPELHTQSLLESLENLGLINSEVSDQAFSIAFQKNSGVDPILSKNPHPTFYPDKLKIYQNELEILQALTSFLTNQEKMSALLSDWISVTIELLPKQRAGSLRLALRNIDLKNLNAELGQPLTAALLRTLNKTHLRVTADVRQLIEEEYSHRNIFHSSYHGVIKPYYISLFEAFEISLYSSMIIWVIKVGFNMSSDLLSLAPTYAFTFLFLLSAPGKFYKNYNRNPVAQDQHRQFFAAVKRLLTFSPKNSQPPVKLLKDLENLLFSQVKMLSNDPESSNTFHFLDHFLNRDSTIRSKFTSSSSKRMELNYETEPHESFSRLFPSFQALSAQISKLNEDGELLDPLQIMNVGISETLLLSETVSTLRQLENFLTSPEERLNFYDDFMDTTLNTIEAYGSDSKAHLVDIAEHNKRVVENAAKRIFTTPPYSKGPDSPRLQFHKKNLVNQLRILIAANSGDLRIGFPHLEEIVELVNALQELRANAIAIEEKLQIKYKTLIEGGSDPLPVQRQLDQAQMLISILNSDHIQQLQYAASQVDSISMGLRKRHLDYLNSEFQQSQVQPVLQIHFPSSPDTELDEAALLSIGEGIQQLLKIQNETSLPQF